MEPEDDTDVETTEDTAPLGGALSAADALSAYQKQQALVQKQIRDNMSLLTGARDKLRQQRVGPSSAEQLFAISAALGRPTRTGTLGETMGNLSTVLGAQEKEKRAEGLEREALLEKYAMQMGNERLRLLQQGLTGAGQVYRGALAAAKPEKTRTGFNPVTGELVDMATGAPIQRADPSLPVLTPEHAALLKQQGIHLKFRTVDGREMEI